MGDRELEQAVAAEPQVQTKKVVQCVCVRVKERTKLHPAVKTYLVHS